MATKFLDNTGLTYLWSKIKAHFATHGETGSAIVAADKAVSIPFGKLDSTSTATVMTATIDGITELRNGICMFLMNGVVTSTTDFTINVNGLGAKPVYGTMAAATRASTLFNINYTGFFVYNEERVSGGCWDFYYGYNSDTNTLGYNVAEYYIGTKKVKTAAQRYQLLLSCHDGLLLPVYSGTYSTATTKVLTTESFNPFGQIYYYNSTANLAANASPAAATLQLQSAYTIVDLRYSFNTGSTLTAGNDIYLVCVPQLDGSVKLHSTPIAYALPTSEDGLVYKRLGKAYDTYRIILELHKPVYYYKNGAIREWTCVDCLDSISQEETFTFAKADKTSNAEIEAVKGNTVVWNQMVYGTNYVSVQNVAFDINNTGTSVIYNYVSTDPYITLKTQPKGHTYYYSLNVNFTSEDTHNRFYISEGQGKAFDIGSSVFTHTSTHPLAGGGLRVLALPAGKHITGTLTFMFFDLTLMFGSGNEPATVEEFEEWLDKNVGKKDYYAYNAGELISVKSTGIKTVGFNQWDEEWEAQGDWGITSKNYCDCLPNTRYYVRSNETSGTYPMYFVALKFYDENKTLITIEWCNNINVTSPANAHYFKVITNSSSYIYGSTYNHDICINFSNPSKNGTYEPYWSETKALPITTMTGKVNGEGSSVVIFPDGLKRVGSIYDEIKVENGVTKAIKRVGSVDISTLSITRFVSGTRDIYHAAIEAKLPPNGDTKPNVICIGFTPATRNTIWAGGQVVLPEVNSTIEAGRVGFVTDNNVYSSAADFTTAMSGHLLYYELATPIEYIVDDFTLPVTVKMDEWGTKLMLPENTSTITTLSPTLSVEYPSTESALEREIEEVNERISDLASLYTKPHHPLHENVRGFWDIVDYGDSAYTSRVESFMPTDGAKWYDAYSSYSIHFNALSTDEYFYLYIDGDNNPILYKQLSSGDTTVNIANYPPNTYRYVVGDQEGTFTIAQERLFYNTDTQIRNVRDLGGMIGAQGCKIRYGLLIRGRGITSYDDYQMGWLNVNVYWRHNNMQGSRFVYSLALAGEISGEYCYNRFALTSSYSLISQMANGLENEDITQLKGVIKSIIVDAINKNNAVYFCCKLGTHRTGVVASILEGLLGCSASDIEKDFELSSGIEQTWSRTGNEVGQADAFRFIRENYNGSWYQWGVENLGLTLEEIETFRYVMLEDYVPNISTYPIWKEDDVLYVERDNSIYPVSHPDLSTQPSILPQRFGVFDIKEVLVKTSLQAPAYYWGAHCIIDDSNTPNYFNTLIDYTQYPRQATTCTTYIYNSEYIVLGDSTHSDSGGEYPTRLSDTLIGNNWFLVPENASYVWRDLRFKIIYPMYDKTLGFPYFKYFLAKYEIDVNAAVYAVTNGGSFVECTLEDALNGNATNPYSQILDPEIPSSATIISASSFNADACVPAICKKEDGKWTITNNEGIEPDFTLVQYYEASEGYYFVPQEQERTVIATLRSDSAARTVPGLNVADVWGNIILPFPEGSIIGRVTIDGNTPSDLIVTEDGAAVVADFAAYQMVILRPSGSDATINDNLDFTVELYAL